MKSIVKSRTFWVNALTFVSTAIVFIQDHELIVDNPDTVAILGGVLALVNIGLRFVTDKPVSITGKANEVQ